MSILNFVQQQIGESVLQNLGSKVGVSPEATSAIAKAGIPAMIAAMATNTSSDEGASSLNEALDEHKGGIQGALGQDAGALLKDGGGILKHLFGSKLGLVEGLITKSAGSAVQPGDTTKVLSGLAPLIMGAIQTKKAEDGLNLGALQSAFSADKGAGLGGMAGDLLGLLGGGGASAGGGAADLLSQGKAALGSLFGKK